jgi:ABC-2 type transport system permease protein
MTNNYSQLKAMMAIIKASFKAQLKSPMALVFGFVFPLFFILLFGSGRSDIPKRNVAFAAKTDVNNHFFKVVDSSKRLFTKHYIISDSAATYDSLMRGKLTAILNIQKIYPDSNLYRIIYTFSRATIGDRDFLQLLTNSTLYKIEKNVPKRFAQQFELAETTPIGNRTYLRIDKVLPGQLGFSLLSAGLFGVAFLFFNLRDTLVLKRINATPIKRLFIILGEGIARVVFQLIVVLAIILLGVFFFDFTLVNGIYTLGSLLFLSFLGLLVFMGFGFIISGSAKSINTIPALTNLLGFPQFMLSGTFFPYEGLPSFLHPISRALPLTHLNNAMFKVSYEGYGITSALPEIGILCVWSVVLYAIAFKIFRWE